MPYGPETVKGGTFYPQREKMGWWEATRVFLFTRQGGALALKLLAMAGFAVSIVDEPLDVIPGLDLLTFGDNVLWVLIPAWAVGRIAWIRHGANKAAVRPRDSR